MNWDRIQGGWKQVKGGLQVRLATLTGDVHRESDGRRQILAGGLQSAYGVGKDQAERQMESWHRSVREVTAGADAAPHRVASGYRIVLEPRTAEPRAAEPQPARLRRSSPFLPITRRRQK